MDRWGTLAGQCQVPGYTNTYPATVNQLGVCNQFVAELPLYNIDPADQLVAYGTAYLFRDYNDVLYVTVSVAATGWREYKVG